VARGALIPRLRDLDKLAVGWLAKAADLLVDGGQALVLCPLELVGEYKFAAESVGLTWRGALVWHCTTPTPSRERDRRAYDQECFAVAWATKGRGTYCWSVADDRAGNMVEGPADQDGGFPSWLVEQLLAVHATPASRVLDPFCGSGAVLAACKARKLAAVGVEPDPVMCGKAKLKLAAQCAA
jgi:DNA modification methylase